MRGKSTAAFPPIVPSGPVRSWARSLLRALLPAPAEERDEPEAVSIVPGDGPYVFVEAGRERVLGTAFQPQSVLLLSMDPIPLPGRGLAGRALPLRPLASSLALGLRPSERAVLFQGADCRDWIGRLVYRPVFQREAGRDAGRRLRNWQRLLDAGRLPAASRLVGSSLALVELAAAWAALPHLLDVEIPLAHLLADISARGVRVDLGLAAKLVDQEMPGWARRRLGDILERAEREPGGRFGVCHPAVHTSGTSAGRPCYSDPDLLVLGDGLAPVLVPPEGRRLIEMWYPAFAAYVAMAILGRLASPPTTVGRRRGRPPKPRIAAADLLGQGPFHEPYAAVAFSALAAGRAWVSRERMLADPAYARLRGRARAVTLAHLRGLDSRSLRVAEEAIREGEDARLDAVVEKDLLHGLADLRGLVPDLLVHDGYLDLHGGLRWLRSTSGRLTRHQVRRALGGLMEGAGAIICKIATLEVAKAIEATDAELVLYRHDSLVLAVPDDDTIASEVGSACTRATADAFERFFPGVRPPVRARPWGPDAHPCTRSFDDLDEPEKEEDE